MEFLDTNASVAGLCRRHNVTPNAFYALRERFIRRGKLGLVGSMKNGASRELEQESQPIDVAHTTTPMG